MGHIEEAATDSIYIVIPTFNERENIVPLIEEIMRLHGARGPRIVVMDDNSPDGTAAAVLSMRPAFPDVHAIVRRGPRGYGHACAEGMAYAIGQGAALVITMDADFSHAPETLGEMIDAAREADLVIGSRYVSARESTVRNWSAGRLWLSRLANLYVNWLTPAGVHDATSGFRCWRAGALSRVLGGSEGHAAGYAFLTETLYRARLAGARIKEIGSVYRGRTKGESKMSLAIVAEALWIPLRVRFSRL
ncbi:MAG: polyprenol monophosphomannose synthase [Bryobacterales bacterium]|nr:polyprenol monophosphomannose synthase [Bryobacterales bacterium]